MLLDTDDQPDGLQRELIGLRQCLAQAEADRARAQAALQRSEALFHAFLDNSPCVAFLKDTAGRTIYGNAGLERLLGISREHFLGRTDKDLFPAATAESLREHDAVVLTTGQTLRTIEVVPDADGIPHSWLVMKFPVPDESGDTFLGGVAVDITERQQAEEKLKHQKAVLQSILHSMAEGVVVADENGEFLHFNPAAERMAGIGRVQAQSPAEWSEQFGIRHTDATTPFPADQLPMACAMRGEAVDDVDLYVQNQHVPEGRWLSVTGRPLTDEGKKDRRGGVIVMRDVTERRRVEAQLQEYAARLQVLSRKLLDVQEKERRHLARELHDEVGQTLTVLKVMLETAAREWPPDREKWDAAKRLVQDLMGQVRSLSMNLRPSMLDDLGLLPALRWQFWHFAEQTGIQVDFNPIGLDRRERLPAEIETAAYRIIQEALTNVARHAGVGKASVLIRREDNLLALRVEDRGSGFDPSAVLGTSGVSGMQERAALLGGTLTVQSQPGAGASPAEDPSRSWHTP